MKLTPASRAFATMRSAVASSVGPPNIIVPRQSGETFKPLRPSLRYSIRHPPGARWCAPDQLADFSAARQRARAPQKAKRPDARSGRSQHADEGASCRSSGGDPIEDGGVGGLLLALLGFRFALLGLLLGSREIGGHD